MLKWLLKEIADDRGVSGVELARAIGIHPNSVYRMWNAKTMPEVDGVMLEKICRALDCKPEDLLELVDEVEKKKRGRKKK